MAGHLLISTSWSYRRCARACLLAIYQEPIATPMMQPSFMPGPWRPFQLKKAPTQLSFDFAEALTLDSVECA